MNDSNSNWIRKRIPYRGEPQPKFPKRRRQIRNLRSEKIQNALTIGAFVFLSCLVIAIALAAYDKAPDADMLGVFVLVFILGLFLTFSVADGVNSINKFRKGYDLDSSVLENDQKNEDTKA